MGQLLQFPQHPERNCFACKHSLSEDSQTYCEALYEWVESEIWSAQDCEEFTRW